MEKKKYFIVFLGFKPIRNLFKLNYLFNFLFKNLNYNINK